MWALFMVFNALFWVTIPIYCLTGKVLFFNLSDVKMAIYEMMIMSWDINVSFFCFLIASADKLNTGNFTSAL